jgi:hypothetical protein
MCGSGQKIKVSIGREVEHNGKRKRKMNGKGERSGEPRERQGKKGRGK